MRSQRLRMTIEEFHGLPRRPGWKHEYFGGKAHLRPGHGVALTTLRLAARVVGSPHILRPVARRDATALAQAFFVAFQDTVEYCDWKAAAVRDSARECIASYFSGARGSPLPASRVAEAQGGVVGAALLVATGDGPLLDMLFVQPEQQRGGLATALVAAAGNDLLAAGWHTLASRYHVANEASRDWHRRFGFEDVPDLHLARMYLQVARHELRRREEFGGLTAEERAALVAERDRWHAEVRRLEAIEQRDGYWAVAPNLRYTGRKEWGDADQGAD